jgi:hypothetical protein
MKTVGYFLLVIAGGVIAYLAWRFGPLFLLLTEIPLLADLLFDVEIISPIVAFIVSLIIYLIIIASLKVSYKSGEYRELVLGLGLLVVSAIMYIISSQPPPLERVFGRQGFEDCFDIKGNPTCVYTKDADEDSPFLVYKIKKYYRIPTDIPLYDSYGRELKILTPADSSLVRSYFIQHPGSELLLKFTK